MLSVLVRLLKDRGPNSEDLLSEVRPPCFFFSTNGSGCSLSSGSLALYSVERELEASLSCDSLLLGLSFSTVFFLGVGSFCGLLSSRGCH
jgi:hypothetical protein